MYIPERTVNACFRSVTEMGILATADHTGRDQLDSLSLMGRHSRKTQSLRGRLQDRSKLNQQKVESGEEGGVCYFDAVDASIPF